MRQSHDHPIPVAGFTISFRLPTISHIHSSSWHDQVIHMGEEHIVAKNGPGPVRSGGKVNKIVLIHHRPVFIYFTIYFESRYPAIGINVQAKMRVYTIIRDLEEIL